MGVPNVFGTATTSIPLNQLDANFNTTATLGNAAVGLGNVTTTVGNLTLTNVTIGSVSTPITPTQGGTGLSTLTANNVIIGNGTGNVTFVAPGANANVLTSNGTAWVSQAGGGGGGGVTTFNAGTTGFTPSTATSGVVTLAGTLAVANGGTGQTTYTNGQLLIGNTTGNTLTKATLTAGSGITITNSTGSISIAATGSGTVTSVATGNGLSGGTITGSGTLVIAAPTVNSVGSYCAGIQQTGGTVASGGTCAGSAIAAFLINSCGGWGGGIGNPPGTWRNMQNDTCINQAGGLWCRTA